MTGLGPIQSLTEKPETAAADEPVFVDAADRVDELQAAGSKLERRDDMLRSTLTSYLTAAGADSVAIMVTMRGREYKFDLGPAPAEPAA